MAMRRSAGTSCGSSRAAQPMAKAPIAKAEVAASAFAYSISGMCASCALTSLGVRSNRSPRARRGRVPSHSVPAGHPRTCRSSPLPGRCRYRSGRPMPRLASPLNWFHLPLKISSFIRFSFRPTKLHRNNEHHCLFENANSPTRIAPQAAGSYVTAHCDKIAREVQPPGGQPYIASGAPTRARRRRLPPITVQSQPNFDTASLTCYSRQLIEQSSSYPERWRDRPCETSATWLSVRNWQTAVPIPADCSGR